MYHLSYSPTHMCAHMTPTPSPTACPFHHLHPHTRVDVQVGGYWMPGTAAIWCDAWHLGEHVRPMLDALVCETTRLLDQLTQQDPPGVPHHLDQT